MPDFESLYSESQANAFTSAKKRFYDNKVSDINEVRSQGKTIITAVVKGHRDYKTKIVFDEQGGLYDYSCDCQGFNMNDGPCKHIIATALSYEEKNPSHAVSHSGFISDSCVRSLISSYAKLRRGKVLCDEVPIKLVPVLIVEPDDSLSLHFTIGKKRMYKLKDLNEFVLAMEGGKFVRYGSALAFEHIIENFDERSRPLVNFLIRTVRERFDPAERSITTIKLRPSDFDDFCDSYDGLLEVEEGGASEGTCRLIRTPDSLKPGIKVVRSDGGFKVSCSLNFRLLGGKRFDYMMTSGNIYRVTDSFVEATYKLLSVLNARDTIFVSDADIGRFYNNVLVEAAKFAEIKSDSDLTIYALPPLKAQLYLSRDGGVIKGELRCYYGDEETDIFTESNDPRDYEAEEMLKETLERYFPYFPHLVLESEADTFKLLRDGIRDIRKFCAVYMSAEMQKMTIRRPPGVKVGVKLSGDLIDLQLSSDDYTYDELIKIIRAAETQKFIRLDESFIDLDDPGLQALCEVMSLSPTLTMPSYYAPHISEELKEYYEVDSAECEKALSPVPVPVPKELDGVMREYQKDGLNWLNGLLCNNFGGILADDMGLGKSLQIISLILAKNLKTIIICPTTLILNWANEFKKFAPHLRILCVMGGFEERFELIKTAEKYDVVITSYELIRRDIEMYTMEFDLGVIDEAQFIKNPETKNSRAVKKLKTEYRFALTGTPIENSLSELWSIFDFIMPGYLFTYSKFKERFEIPIVGGDMRAADELRRFVMPFILRRLKSDVLTELPPKIETNIVAPLSGEQEEQYKAHLSLIRRSILSDPSVNKVTILAMLMKLRRICCDPSLEDSSYKGNSAKLEACMQLVESAIKSGHKTLIFSQFTSMLDLIRAQLLSRGITNYMLTGDTPKADRMKFVNRFNKDDTQVFLISLRAGGTGLNLVGADVVIHYDPWWNLSVMNQATDRAYRIGQQKSVQVYSLILSNTLEEKIVELQQRKAKLSGLIEELDLNELVSLLS